MPSPEAPAVVRSSQNGKMASLKSGARRHVLDAGLGFVLKPSVPLEPTISCEYDLLQSTQGRKGNGM